jgi:hypothetical protein
MRFGKRYQGTRRLASILLALACGVILGMAFAEWVYMPRYVLWGMSTLFMFLCGSIGVLRSLEELVWVRRALVFLEGAFAVFAIALAYLIGHFQVWSNGAICIAAILVIMAAYWGFEGLRAKHC